MKDSCFIARLSYYLDLTDAERRLLASLEEHEREYARHTEVFAAGEPVRHLYLVKSGWLYSSVGLADGRRQILRIHHPGDIMGLSDIAFTQSTSTLQTSTPATLCPFPKSALTTILEDSPRLSALLFTLEMREQVFLADLVRALGRMLARARVAHLLLDLVTKLRITNPDMHDRFPLHLSQGEIGDALGLSNVHVSNTLAAMARDGLIARDGHHVTVLRESELVELCDFEDRYSRIDTSWFPGP